MTYTEEVRKELDAILKAFENYIDEQNYFDIVYSKKIGYVWIVADEPGAAGAEQLNTPEAMLDNLFNDIINDVVAPRSATHLNKAHTMTECEEAEYRRRITVDHPNCCEFTTKGWALRQRNADEHNFSSLN